MKTGWRNTTVGSEGSIRGASQQAGVEIVYRTRRGPADGYVLTYGIKNDEDSERKAVVPLAGWRG